MALKMSRYPGVRYREHESRKHGPRPDRYYFLRYRRADGRRVEEALGWSSQGYTAELASSLLAEIQRNIRTGQRPQSLAERRAMAEAERLAKEQAAAKAAHRDMTLRDLADRYRAWAKAERSDIADIEQRLDQHVLPVLGDMRAADVTPADVTRLRDVLQEKRPQAGRGKTRKGARLAPATVTHCLKLVREIYNFAAETAVEGNPGVMLHTGPNPARMSKRGRGVRPPRGDNRRLRILSEEEVRKLLGHQGTRRADMAEIRDMILFALDTGLRAGELVALARSAVDKDTGAVRVYKTGESQTTKSGRSRLVHAGQLYPECRDMLRRRLETPAESPWLFPGRGGKRRGVRSLSRVMERLCAALGLNKDVEDDRDRAVWHTLRHTCATRLLESGLDLYVVKEILGHSSVTTTEGYIHLCDPVKRAQALARIALAREQQMRPATASGSQ